MRNGLSAIVIGAALALCAGRVLSAPVLVDYADIVPFSYENFEEAPVGDFSNPGSFEVFSFDAVDPLISESETVCRSNSKCLTANDLLLVGIRTFSTFRPGTKAFGVELGFVNPDQFSTLEITAAGRHTTRIFSGFSTSDLLVSLGIQDKMGLMSVSFAITSDLEGLGGPFRTNYSFDNVITSVRPAKPVPIPAAIWLLGGALFVLASVKRPRPRWQAATCGPKWPCQTGI
ncbi:MAG: VPLPA-CTERM sorting domain-containing protein [Boseongicola sp.]